MRKGRPHGCLVVLAAGLLCALVGAAIGYATYEPCVSDEFLGCLFDDPKVNAFQGGFLGLVIGICAGLVLLPLWPRGGGVE
jgi:hypothetical protein